MDRTMRRRILRVAFVLPMWLGLIAATGVLAEPEFDHDMTRFPLFGAHDRTPCESCHVGARFVGTPTDCGYCHDGTNKWAETAKHPMHFPTSSPCNDCHASQSWLPARMDHAGVSERCVTCHNFGFAEGKSARHPQSSDTCGDCHNTLTWSGARFDHTNVTSGCFTCHNGVDARGKEMGHVASSNECQFCHSTRRWSPASFDHSNVTESCTNCHAGDKGSGHFVTSLDCNACHSTTTWGNEDYTHVGNYPGDHNRSVGCRDCHTANSSTIQWPSPMYQPDCAGCHANDYKADEDDHNGIAQDRNCGNSGCHRVTANEF